MSSLRLLATRNTSTLRSLTVPTIAKRSPYPRYSTATMSSTRLLDEIKIDHMNVQDLLNRFNEAYKQKNEQLCTDIANTIIHEAAIHSDGEELSIYKTMEDHGMNTSAEKDREDHQKVKQAMAELDTHDISTVGLDKYAERVVSACHLFLEHAREEEEEQLPQLCKILSENDQTKAIADFLNGRNKAPTRPHPSAPQSGGMVQEAVGAMERWATKPRILFATLLSLSITTAMSRPLEVSRLSLRALHCHRAILFFCCSP